MEARLLARFPHLRGLEGVFTSDDDGDGNIAEWLIPFEDLTVGEMVGAGASAVVLKVRTSTPSKYIYIFGSHRCVDYSP